MNVSCSWLSLQLRSLGLLEAATRAINAPSRVQLRASIKRKSEIRTPTCVVV